MRYWYVIASLSPHAKDIPTKSATIGSREVVSVSIEIMDPHLIFLLNYQDLFH